MTLVLPQAARPAVRCWLPQDSRLAGRDEMAIRQILGFFLCAGFLWGFFVWLISKRPPRRIAARYQSEARTRAFSRGFLTC